MSQLSVVSCPLLLRITDNGQLTTDSSGNVYIVTISYLQSTICNWIEVYDEKNLDRGHRGVGARGRRGIRHFPARRCRQYNCSNGADRAGSGGGAGSNGS